MIPTILLVLVLFLSVLATVCSSATEMTRFNSALHGSVLTDPEGTLSFGVVSSRDYAARFSANNSTSFNFLISQDTHWIRFFLPERASFVPAEYLSNSSWNDLVLYFDYANIDHAHIYVPVTVMEAAPGQVLSGAGGVYQRFEIGWLDGPRPDHSSYVFPSMDLPANFDRSRPIFVRLRSDYTLNVRPLVEHRTSFAQRQIHLTAFLFLTLGIVAAVVLSNVLFYVQMGDPQYITYAVYASALLVYQNGIGGTLFALGSAAGQFMAGSVVVWAHLAMFSALRFAQGFLQVDTTAPKMVKFFRGFRVIGAVGAILAALNFRYEANWLAYFVGMFGPFLLVGTAAYVFIQSKKGPIETEGVSSSGMADESAWTGVAPTIGWTPYQVSPYYLAASVMVFISVLTFVLRGLAVLPHSLVTAYALSGIGAAEALLYSLALSDRLRRLHEDRAEMQAERHHLTEMSLTDELTQLGNRRAFNQWLLDFVEDPQPAVVMYLDIDRFKRINDTFGHAQGDKVLQLLGQVIRETVRENDGCFRIGGEEFAVILQNIDEAQAGQVAERIRQRFAAVPSILDGQKVNATVSIGCSLWQPREPMEKTLLRADQALYRAKEQGRNQVYWIRQELA